MAKTKKPRALMECYMYPENGKRYIHIAVMRTQADLRLLAKAHGVAHSQTAGFCKALKGKRFALVGLYKRGLSPRIVSHEFTHAALMYLSDVDDLPKDPYRSANERLCHLVGNSTADFYKWAKDKNLY